jgi:hypothetical protein
MLDLFEGFLHGADLEIVEAFEIFNEQLFANFVNQRSIIAKRYPETYSVIGVFQVLPFIGNYQDHQRSWPVCEEGLGERGSTIVANVQIFGFIDWRYKILLLLVTTSNVWFGL